MTCHETIGERMIKWLTIHMQQDDVPLSDRKRMLVHIAQLPLFEGCLLNWRV